MGFAIVNMLLYLLAIIGNKNAIFPIMSVIKQETILCNICDYKDKYV